MGQKGVAVIQEFRWSFVDRSHCRRQCARIESVQEYCPSQVRLRTLPHNSVSFHGHTSREISHTNRNAATSRFRLFRHEFTSRQNHIEYVWCTHRKRHERICTGTSIQANTRISLLTAEIPGVCALRANYTAMRTELRRHTSFHSSCQTKLAPLW